MTKEETACKKKSLDLLSRRDHSSLELKRKLLDRGFSIELVDREGHLITTNALGKAFDKYMENFRTRNAMVLHSDVQNLIVV